MNIIASLAVGKSYSLVTYLISTKAIVGRSISDATITLGFMARRYSNGSPSKSSIFEVLPPDSFYSPLGTYYHDEVTHIFNWNGINHNWPSWTKAWGISNGNIPDREDMLGEGLSCDVRQALRGLSSEFDRMISLVIPNQHKKAALGYILRNLRVNGLGLFLVKRKYSRCWYLERFSEELRLALANITYYDFRNALRSPSYYLEQSIEVLTDQQIKLLDELVAILNQAMDRF